MKLFTRKLYLSLVVMLFGIYTSAQSVSVTNESFTGNCDGSAILNNSSIYTAWSWMSDSVNVIQSGGDTITGLCAGTYILQYTDSSGTFDYAFGVGTDSTVCTGFSISATAANESVSGNCDGSATVATTGGTAPFTYSWNNGATTQQTSSLCAGSYTVTVFDANGCNSSSSVTVASDSTSCAGFNATANAVNDTTGTCTGYIYGSVSGGTQPYVYTWNTGDSTSTVSGVCAGTYVFTATDANGCSGSYTVVVTTDTAVNPCANFGASISSTNESSNGTCNGSATVSAFGGTTPYSYIWSDSSTTTSISGLCSGTYTVDVYDATGCSTTVTAVVNADSTSNPGTCNSFVVTATSTNESSNGACDGSAVATATGGNGAYSFTWSNSATTSAISNLCNGSYTVTVVDDSACSATYSVYIYSDSANVPNQLYGYVMTTDVSANGICDGSAQAVVYGGVTPYTYYYSNGSTSSIADSLCAGPQTVMITDANGDSLMLSYLISSPSNTVTNPTYQDSTTVDTLVSDLIENCVIDYASVDSALIDLYNFFTADSVTVTWAVYDANGVTYITETYYIGGGNGVYTIELSLNCSQKGVGDFLKARDQIYFNTSLVSAVGINEVNNLELNVYPNPFNEFISISLNSVDDYTVQLLDISGKIIFNQQIKSTNLINLNLNDLASGQYILVVQNEKGLITKKLIK